MRKANAVGPAEESTWRRPWVWVVLLALTLLAAFLRLYRLNEVPPGLFFDEAADGLDALDVLAGRFALFFPRAFGREPLYIYLVTPLVALLGRVPLALRLPAALAGVATVPATFLLVRELLWRDGRRVADAGGLIAAGLLASGFWATSMNRIAFRANLLPLLLALSFWLGIRMLRRGGAWRGIGAGALLGLCLYTYVAGRFAFLLVVPGLAMLYITRDGWAILQARRRELLVALAACAVVAAPLMTYFAVHPEDFVGRAGMTLQVDPTVRPGSYSRLLWEGVRGHLGMFGGPGDEEPRHNIPDRSLLTPWLAVLFWGGVAVAVAQARRAGRRFALAWFVLLLLPSILAVVTPTHMLRPIGIMPVVYFFPALLITQAARWIAGRPANRSKVAWRGIAAAAVVLVGVETTVTVRDYFGTWANALRTRAAYLQPDAALAAEINAAPVDVGYVVPLNPSWQNIGGKYNLQYLIDRTDAWLPFFADPASAAGALQAFLDKPGYGEVRFVRMAAGDDALADPHDFGGLLLGQTGARRETLERDGYKLDVYSIDSAHAALSLPAPDRSAGVALEGAQPQAGAIELAAWGMAAGLTTDGALPLALRWRVVAPPGRQLSISLRALDAGGGVVGQSDAILVDDRGARSDRWMAGAEVSTYHALALAPGTPIDAIRLGLYLYEADGLRRWTTRLPNGLPGTWIGLVASGPDGAPPATAAPVAPEAGIPLARFAGGITLQAVRAESAGEGFDVELTWHAGEALDQDYVAFVHLLGADGAILAQHDGEPDAGRRRTSGWQAGETIADRHPLAVSDPSAGARLRIGLYLPATDARVPLAGGGDFVEIDLGSAMSSQDD